ncbi:MAG: carboxypeptidase regulatory-like domain-containing protein [Candidatus Wallbacteria bacterium]
MVSYKLQRLVLVLTLFISTAFLYGCNSSTSSSSSDSTLRFEVRDVTTKAALDDATIMVSGPDPTNAGGAVSILRQITTDSRGKATADGLPAERRYTVTVSKEGYQAPSTANANTQPQFIPDITQGLVTEQGKSYDVVCYMIKANSPTTGTIKGYVKNRVTGEPISNATVFVAPSGLPSIIDTTDKTSKPGYYELTNVPSGTQTLSYTVPGITSASSTGISVTIPANGTVDYDIMVDPTTGKIKGYVLASANETLPPGNYVVQVLRNGTDVVASATFDITNSGASGSTSSQSKEYTVENVPVILPGSTATYTVKVITDVAHMVNPAAGVSGIVLRGSSQELAIAPITVMPEKGSVLVTLYHPPILTTNVLAETESGLTTMAPQATITVEGALVETVFVNEGPTRFYRYRVNNVPVGKRTLIIGFPNHKVDNATVSAVKDIETQVLFTLTESSSGGAAKIE